MPKIVAHLDLDAFFAAVEELENPELRGVALVVGGDPQGRGVVTTAVALVGAAALISAALLIAAGRSDAPRTLDDRVEQIASGLGCVTCLNLSVADSPAGTARAMRAEIKRRLLAGETSDQIKGFFVAKYGQSILLSPHSPFPWIAPGLALGAGVGILAWALWRRRPAPTTPDPRLTPAERQRIRLELAALEEPD